MPKSLKYASFNQLFLLFKYFAINLDFEKELVFALAIFESRDRLIVSLVIISYSVGPSGGIDRLSLGFKTQ